MSSLHRFINELDEREQLDEVYLVADKQLRANRNGNLYLQLRLTDRTGAITGMLWNASDNLFNSFDTGNYLRVQGTTQIHNGQLQMIVTRIEPADPGSVDEADFAQVSSEDIERHARRLAELLRSVQNAHLRNLAECFLADEDFMRKFTTAPAGIKNHHAYRGGLVAHVVSLMEVCRVVAPLYPELDADLLLLGAFLHDASKTDELVYEREMGYSDEGQLGWLKGYCHPIRFNDLVAKGAVPKELLDKLPPAAAYEKAVFPSLDAVNANSEAVKAGWDKVVGADVVK